MLDSKGSISSPNSNERPDEQPPHEELPDISEECDQLGVGESERGTTGLMLIMMWPDFRN